MGNATDAIVAGGCRPLQTPTDISPPPGVRTEKRRKRKKKPPRGGNQRVREYRGNPSTRVPGRRRTAARCGSCITQTLARHRLLLAEPKIGMPATLDGARFGPGRSVC
jgi:hypothetical protein